MKNTTKTKSELADELQELYNEIEEKNYDFGVPHGDLMSLWSKKEMIEEIELCKTILADKHPEYKRIVKDPNEKQFDMDLIWKLMK